MACAAAAAAGNLADMNALLAALQAPPPTPAPTAGAEPTRALHRLRPEPMAVSAASPEGWAATSSTGILAPRLARPTLGERTWVTGADAAAQATQIGLAPPAEPTQQAPAPLAATQVVSMPPLPAWAATQVAPPPLEAAASFSPKMLLCLPGGILLGLALSLGWYLRPPEAGDQTPLRLQSTPPGAAVWAGNRLLCASTPCALSWAHADAGRHISLRYELAGHAPTVLSRVLRGHPLRLAPRLLRAPDPDR